jgi:putative transposase
MKSVVQIQRQGKVKDVRASAAASGLPIEEIETTVALIQALIPLGRQAVGKALDAEVTALAGTRYCRTGGQAGVVRWGQQRGSVYLADQKLPIPVPRMRDRAANREVSLTTYEQLQRPRAADAGLFRKILVGLTCRQDAACVEAEPPRVGLPSRESLAKPES